MVAHRKVLKCFLCEHKLKELSVKQLPKEKKLKEAPEVVIAKAVSHMMKKDKIFEEAERK